MESSSSSSTTTSASQELNEVQVSVRPVLRTGAPNNNNMVMGKHRLAAAISALNQQINIIQEELDQLDSFGEASLVCREARNHIIFRQKMASPLLTYFTPLRHSRAAFTPRLTTSGLSLLSVTVETILVSSVELVPDALLPVTRGPINVHLDRWFHGAANDSRRNKRWI